MDFSTLKILNKSQKTFLFLAVFFLFFSRAPLWGNTELPLELPKGEGSKSFDLEISQINSQGIKNYMQGLFPDATAQFKKALTLSKQLRDPSQGILHYNLSLSLHKSGKHEEATKQFSSAKRFARGNPKILKSERLKMHELY